MKNKKGASLLNWIFVVATILLFLVILQTSVLNPMNDIYGQDFETGLDTSGLDDLQSLKETTDAEVTGSDVTQTNDGLSLTSTWTIGKGMYSTLVSFVGGNFISNLLTDILNLPPVVANVLVLLIWLSLITIILYIFMKVVI